MNIYEIVYVSFRFILPQIKYFRHSSDFSHIKLQHLVRVSHFSSFTIQESGIKSTLKRDNLPSIFKHQSFLYGCLRVWVRAKVNMMIFCFLLLFAWVSHLISQYFIPNGYVKLTLFSMSIRVSNISRCSQGAGTSCMHIQEVCGYIVQNCDVSKTSFHPFFKNAVFTVFSHYIKA